MSFLGHGFPAIAAPWEETTVDCTGATELWMESEARVNREEKRRQCEQQMSLYGQVSRMPRSEVARRLRDHSAHSPFAVFPSDEKIPTLLRAK